TQHVVFCSVTRRFARPVKASGQFRRPHGTITSPPCRRLRQIRCPAGSPPLCPARPADTTSLLGTGMIAGLLECVRRIEPAVRIRVNQKGQRVAGVGAWHVRHEASVLIASITRRRARARRDITVPTGTAVTSAISRYSSP